MLSLRKINGIPFIFLSSEMPNFQSLDVNIHPGVTTKTRKVNRIMIARRRVESMWLYGKNGNDNEGSN